MAAPVPTTPTPLESQATEGLLSVAHRAEFPRSGLLSWARQLVVFSHSRVELPWFRFAGRTDSVAMLHRLALRQDEERPRKIGAIEKCVAGLLHAFNALHQSFVYYRKYGGYARRARRMPRGRLLRLGWSCLFHNNQLPRHFYERHLFDEPDPVRWLDHLEHRHLTVLLGALNDRLPTHRLTNKLLFAEHCRAHHLPVSPTLAAWNGAGRVVIEPQALPAADLYAKPLADFGGAGTVAIPWRTEAGGYEFEGQILRGDQLVAALARSSIGRGCLLQKQLRSPATLTDWLGRSDVANMRIVTGHFPDEAPCIIAAGLRVPSRFTTFGHDRSVLMAPVGLSDGRLGVAHLRNTCGSGYAKHPDTGADIAGRILPRWNEMKELVLAAHHTCPWMPFIGWDVVDSDQGLVLLEANAYWGANVVQLPGAPSLGQTDFPAMYLAWHRYLGLPGVAGGS